MVFKLSVFLAIKFDCIINQVNQVFIKQYKLFSFGGNS